MADFDLADLSFRYKAPQIHLAQIQQGNNGGAGWHHFARLGWVDSFDSAAMILGGMGPTEPLQSDGAKIFAGLYALYSGLVLIASTAVILSPFMTHVLHAFHAEDDLRDGK